jgi:beta-phosphoglucomutase family hydrolase
MAPRIDWSSYEAVLFDLDGVLTPTAEVHVRAWTGMFDRYLAEHADEIADPSPFTEADYLAYVDGRPRYDGVRTFLASRGVTLPEGQPTDAPGDTSICALGNRKNEAFNEIVAREGIDPYPAAETLLDRLHERGLKSAVVSSSKNARGVLGASALKRRFDVIVDGIVVAEQGIAGKPAPDAFLLAAEELDVDPARAVVVEDAVSGVNAGAAGKFGLVIGVDRGAGADALLAGGADLVVDDLGDLLAGDGPVGDSRE